MLYFHGTPSPVKSIPGLVSASATGLVIHEQPIRFGADVYVIPETPIPIAYDGEDTTCRVALCNGPSGHALVLVEGDAMPVGYAEVCYLARLRLASASDTPETVDVHVTRRECTTETPADATVHQVSATPVLPDTASQERVASRRRLRRIRYLKQQLRTLKEAGTGPAAFTAAQWRMVNELVALQTDGVPMLVEDVPV